MAARKLTPGIYRVEVHRVKTTTERVVLPEDIVLTGDAITGLGESETEITISGMEEVAAQALRGALDGHEIVGTEKRLVGERAVLDQTLKENEEFAKKLAAQLTVLDTAIEGVEVSDEE